MGSNLQTFTGRRVEGPNLLPGVSLVLQGWPQESSACQRSEQGPIIQKASALSSRLGE